MRRTTATRGEDGAALVLVLIIVTVIALALSALLTRADTGLRATRGLHGQATETYDADGALQAAINNLRNSTFNGGSNRCFDGSDTLRLDGFTSTGSASVTCKADPKKVLIQCPSLSSCNRPGNAILTLGRVAGEDGVNIQQPTGSTFRVRGNVYSNSTLNVVNGTLNTNARVWARGACTGTIQSTPAPACNSATSGDTLGDDPGYSPALATAPVRQTLPACAAAGSVVTFEPGLYDDAVGLSTMMKGNSPCRNSTWWFKPGTYYFDFRNSGPNANPLLPAGDNVWTVDDGWLVAGRPVDAAGNPLAAPPVPARIPGSCDNPIKNAAAVGVRFVFGGDSRFEVKSGEAEICGTYSVDRPPVAVYGLSSGTETVTSWTGPDALTMSSVTSAGPFANPTLIAEADGRTSAWVKPGNNPQTGSVTVNGYAPAGSIPAGSVLTAAKLVAVYGNTGGATQDDRSVRISPAGGSPFTVQLPSYADNAMHTESIDLRQNGLGTLSRLVDAGSYTGTELKYTATLKHGGIEHLDALRLELTFARPSLRANSGCVTSTPYTGGGSKAATCAMVSTINNDGNQFYVQGTSYAPKAAIDIVLNNAAEQVFRFGVISRTLWVRETGSFSYDGVVIEVPDDSPGFVFSMYLTAHLCADPATCAPALTAKVALVDDNPATPVPGRRQVTVLSWTRPG